MKKVSIQLTVFYLAFFSYTFGFACSDIDIFCQQREGKLDLPIPTPQLPDQECRGDICRAFNKIGTEAKNALTDTAKTITTGKPHGDIAKEFGRAGNNINEAAISAGHFIENQVKAAGETLSDADKRVREGKLIDAVWHISTDPAKHTEKNFGQAVTESSLLNDVATATASIYGGPQGAAAYAAWYTYKRTGNLDLALKAGVIAGATSKGLKVVNGMPSGTISELAKKTLASASIGGAAVAASGGGEKEIIEAFVKGAALTAAREQYKKMLFREIEGRAPTKNAIAKKDPNIRHQFAVLVDRNRNPILDSKGNFQVDIRTVPPDISQVGLETSDPSAPVLSAAETSPLMQAIAKLPYMNDMAAYHDQWAAVAQMEGIEIQATILPAAILTIAGSDTPIISQAMQENINQRRGEGAGSIQPSSNRGRGVGSIQPPSDSQQTSLDCADCTSVTRDSNEPTQNNSLAFDAESKAKDTCTLSNQIAVTAVESCIGDMTENYIGVFDEVEGDYEVDIRNTADDYFGVSKKYFRDACDVLRTTSKNAEIGKSRFERCVLRTKSAVREMVSYVREKYPRPLLSETGFTP